MAPAAGTRGGPGKARRGWAGRAEPSQPRAELRRAERAAVPEQPEPRARRRRPLSPRPPRPAPAFKETAGPRPRHPDTARQLARPRAVAAMFLRAPAPALAAGPPSPPENEVGEFPSAPTPPTPCFSSAASPDRHGKGHQLGSFAPSKRRGRDVARFYLLEFASAIEESSDLPPEKQVPPSSDDRLREPSKPRKLHK